MDDALWVRVPLTRRDEGYDDEVLQADAATYIDAIISRAEYESAPGQYALGRPTTWAPTSFVLELRDAFDKIPPAGRAALPVHELAELVARYVAEQSDLETPPARPNNEEAPSEVTPVEPLVVLEDGRPLFIGATLKEAAVVMDVADLAAMTVEDREGGYYQRTKDGKWEAISNG